MTEINLGWGGEQKGVTVASGLELADWSVLVGGGGRRECTGLIDWEIKSTYLVSTP